LLLRLLAFHTSFLVTARHITKDHPQNTNYCHNTETGSW
jgi:hypothetical protein